MADVKWLLEPEVFQHDGEPLLDALVRKGVEHKVCQFGESYEELVASFPEDDCVVMWGSLQLAKVVQRNTKWVPGVYCNLPKLECLYYYPRFAGHLLNSDYAMFPFGELRHKKGWIYYNFGKDDCVFIRPSSGFKTFTGRIVEKVDWERDIRDLSFKLDPESLVLVCRPIEIAREWRLVVSDHIVACSQYKEGKGLVRLQGSDIVKTKEVPERVLEYGRQVLSAVKFKPDPIWTMDIGETATGNLLKVLEVGSFSCAGLYACDPDPIIDEIQRVASKDWEDRYGDPSR